MFPSARSSNKTSRRGGLTSKLNKFVWAEINQPSNITFFSLEEFLIGKVPLYNNDRRGFFLSYSPLIITLLCWGPYPIRVYSYLGHVTSIAGTPP